MIIVTHPLFDIITLPLENLLAKLFNAENNAASTSLLVQLVVRRRLLGKKCLRFLLAIMGSFLDSYMSLNTGMPVHHTTVGFIP